MVSLKNSCRKEMETQSVDSHAQEKRPREKPITETRPNVQEPKVIPLLRKRGRGRKSQIVVLREDDEKDLR